MVNIHRILTIRHITMSRRMNRLLLSTTFLLNSVFLTTSDINTSKEIHVGDPKVRIRVWNDSPTIADAKTTFYAEISVDSSGEENSDLYYYEWKDDVNWHLEESQVSYTYTQYSVKYTELEIDQDHVMEVKVFKYKNGKKRGREIAKERTAFSITEFINGNLSAKQQNVTSTSEWTYGTNQSIEFTADIYDPSHYFSSSQMFFTWELGNNKSQNTTMPSAMTRYTSPGNYEVKVDIRAWVPVPFINAMLNKTGHFHQRIKLMDAVSNVAVAGNNKVTEGHHSNYTLTCNGSMPITMCWAFNPNGNCDNANQTFSDICEEVVLTKTCQFNLVHSFNATGDMCLTVVAYNDVSLGSADLDIKVNKADPGPSPAVTVSMTTLAVLTAFGGIIVAIFAVHQVLRARKVRRIEVADFDFIRSYKRRESSQTSTFAGFGFWSNKKTEKKPLINEYKSSASKHKYSSFQEIL